MGLARRCSPMLSVLISTALLGACATETRPAPPPWWSGTVRAQGVGFPQPGTEGNDAAASAFVAALVGAVGELALLGDQVKFTPEPKAAVADPLDFFRVRVEHRPTRGAYVLRTTTVFKAMVVDSLVVVGLPGEAFRSRAPLTLVAKDLVLVSPPIGEIDRDEVRAGIARAGLGQVVTASYTDADGARVVLAVAAPPRVTGPPPRVDCAKPPTGLIVDARGLIMLPVLTPTILTASGRGVYGVARVAPGVLAERGVASYSARSEVLTGDESVGPAPLVVRALASTGRNSGDAVVRDEDWEAVEAADRCRPFLRQGRVMILLDRPSEQPPAPPR